MGGSKEGTDKAALLGYIFGGVPYDGGVYTQQFYAGGSSNYGTFYLPTGLKNVTVTGGKISYGAFHNCNMLTEVRLPSGITSIGQRAFENCTSLHTVTFTGNAPSISGNSFNAVTAAALYPAGNETWSAEAMGNYGGTLTWQADMTVMDLNDDGKISVFDAQLLLEARQGLRTLTQEQWTAIGSLTAQDIVNYILSVA